MRRTALLIATALLAPLAFAVARRRRRQRAALAVPLQADADPLTALAATLPPVQDLTREQLYDLARELDIPRRSKMRKRELAAAVANSPRYRAAAAA